MTTDSALRKQLLELLDSGNAHAKFEQAVEGFPLKRVGVRPEGSPHSAWELLEHLRIAQHDILEFSLSADHQSPKWPEGYWPKSPAPEREEQWNESVRSFKADRKAFEALLKDDARDLNRPFPWGEGQTLLREALLVADHNAYHLGQLVLVRRLVGAWPE